MIINKIFKPALFSVFLSMMISCSSDEDPKVVNPDTEGYNTEVYITDAPIDNAEVQAVFVTVSDVKVNGKSLEGFQKTTVELSSLVNGEAALLGDTNLEAGSTSSITLTLDHAADASGNTPGSYILTAGGEKKALGSGTQEIAISDNAEIMASDDNELVLDFDLRKAIIAESDGTYSFAGESQLSSSIRAVNSLNAGVISGSVSNMETFEGETLLVFAYNSDTYSESEMEENGEGVSFSNAVTSSAVSQSSGDFSLHFLEEGTYELHFVSLSDEDGDGQMEVEGEFEMTTAAEIALSDIEVSANSTTSIEVLLAGLLGL